MLETYDLIVIGGGRAANLAIPAAKAGMKTLLIERDLLGGACPNRGCVPSKLLIGFGFAQQVHRARDEWMRIRELVCNRYVILGHRFELALCADRARVFLYGHGW